VEHGAQRTAPSRLSRPASSRPKTTAHIR
jgi:hypothetical protein